ncbi:MAG: hypothetical protein MUP13_16005, partial [Thermoanaerobaculales bacterium]|nr:hypothetical protein [Thermoanaerobaculales bacterium]
LDTARLARHVLTRDEVPNCKLGTLARHFRAEVTPNHRALSDARATVDVLHGLMERVGNLGVHSLTELQGYSSRVPEARRRKRGTHRRRREPRPMPGMLLHLDGSKHQWFCDERWYDLTQLSRFEG